MSEVASAAVVESAPTTPVFDPGDQHTWSPEQREDWNKTGNVPKKQESAPAPKEEKKEPPAESATAKETTDAAGAEPAKDQEYKTRTEKRFTEVLDEVKRLKQELAEARKPREVAAPQPAPKPNEFVKLDSEKWFKDNPGKTYEDFVDAAADHRANWLLAERDRKAAEAAVQKDLTDKFGKLKERYPDAEKIFPTANRIMSEQGIPDAVKAAVSRSPQMEHLLYVLSGDENTVAHFISTAKSDPLQAVRLIFQMEQDIKSELEKGGSGKEIAEPGKETPARGEDGKFLKKDPPEEPKPRAPKPPPEVGGKGSAPDDALRAAAAANDFRAFEAEENRRRFAKQ